MIAPRILSTLVVGLWCIAAPAAAQMLAGEARAIDGDSISVSGIEVRLFGIDAPEAKQTCNRDGREWPCGEAAAGKLGSLVEGQQVTCRGRGRDVYGRTVAVCHAGSLELNRTMVAYGWATAFRAYASDYVADETRAKATRLGIWDSRFVLPEDYRHANAALQEASPTRALGSAARRASAPAPMGRCAIKGNRGRRGWIYHVPGMQYYEATRAEEIFCTEAEARAAGYRRAKV